MKSFVPLVVGCILAGLNQHFYSASAVTMAVMTVAFAVFLVIYNDVTDKDKEELMDAMADMDNKMKEREEAFLKSLQEYKSEAETTRQRLSFLEQNRSQVGPFGG